MNRSVEFTGMFVEHCGTPCASHCRFCILGSIKPDNLPFQKFASLVERLDGWRQDKGTPEFDLVFNWMRAENWDFETTKAMKQLHRKVMPEIQDALFMGGIVFKSDEELLEWLAQRRGLGTPLIWVSLAGSQELHNKWVGRKGDFEFNMKAIEFASQLGFLRGEVLFLTKSTLPLIEPLLDLLDAIPGREWRKLRIVHYRGRGKRMMHERITQEDLEQLSPRVLRDLQERDTLRTQTEWVSLFSQGHASEPIRTRLFLNVTESGFADLESKSCDEIVEGLERRTRSVWEMLPDANFLSRLYGTDHTDDKRLYPAGELERIWIDRYLQEHPRELERELTTWTNH